MYLTNPINLKSETFYLSIKSESHFFDSNKNIIKNQPVVSYYLLLKLKDQILQLTKKMLNLII